MRKRLFYTLFCILGIILIYASYKRIYKDSLVQIPVLMYHHFDTEGISETTIHPQNFQRHLKFLKEEGYETVTIEELIGFLKQKKPFPKKPIIITIDDGYLSNYTLAYPVLKEENMKATIFVVTSFREKQPGVTPHFTWEQAKEMYDLGLVDIQSHSYNSHYKIDTIKGSKGALTRPIHSDIKIESDEEFEKRIKEDLLKSKEDIEKNIGNKVIALAYPFGEYSRASEKAAKEVGYRATFIIKDKMNYEDATPHLLKRIQVSGYDIEEDLAKKIKYSKSSFTIIDKVKAKIVSIITSIKDEEVMGREIEIYINGGKVHFPTQSPYIDRNFTILVPVEDVVKSLGAEFTYDEAGGVVLVKNKETKVQFIIDSDKVYINGEEKQMNNTVVLTPKKVIMVPLRFLGEALEKTVIWNEKEKIIYIN